MITAQYFNESEFKRCTPPCSLQDMNQSTMKRLDCARSIAGIPFVINSAYRTPEYEKAHGRKGTSSHTLGRAVDIRCNTSENRYKIIKAALECGICRIGVGSNFIHLDNDGSLAQNVIFHYYNK